jgi:hypothetical protein
MKEWQSGEGGLRTRQSRGVASVDSTVTGREPSPAQSPGLADPCLPSLTEYTLLARFREHEPTTKVQAARAATTPKTPPIRAAMRTGFSVWLP